MVIAGFAIVGWFFLIVGLVRMFFPELQRGNQNTPAAATSAVNTVLVAIGALLTVQGYRRSSSSGAGN